MIDTHFEKLRKEYPFADITVVGDNIIINGIFLASHDNFLWWSCDAPTLGHSGSWLGFNKDGIVELCHCIDNHLSEEETS